MFKKKTHKTFAVFENFCVKSNLTVCKVTFYCKLQKKFGGAGCTSCSRNNFVGGAAPPVPAPMKPCCGRVTARCRWKIRYISKFTAASRVFSAIARLSCSDDDDDDDDDDDIIYVGDGRFSTFWHILEENRAVTGKLRNAVNCRIRYVS